MSVNPTFYQLFPEERLPLSDILSSAVLVTNVRIWIPLLIFAGVEWYVDFCTHLKIPIPFHSLKDTGASLDFEL